jgi:NitT/TauT family transport system substrate-binding protein
VFAPQWLPQAQFAGYYIALEKGFYKEAGLDVEIVHPSANIQATAMIASGKADLISLFLISAMSARNQGLELVNTGQLSQHSAILFVTKKTSGIEQLSQLNGKKIGIWKSGFDEVPKALMAEKKYRIEWIPILSTINLFMMNGIDAMTIMSYNEYHQILNSGMNADELNTFPVAEYGFDVPEDGLYCLKSTFDNKKKELRKFLEATLKGWDYAAANKDYAIDITLKRMKELHLPANRAHQEWMLNKTLELFSPGNKSVARGELLETDFRKAADILNKMNRTDTKYSFTDFYQSLLK